MSEYQSYEFVAIDRPLSPAVQAELRRISTRGRITATSFSNEYHWGDFKGDTAQMMRDWFDVFVYHANWGTHWCMIRLPLALIDLDAARAYECERLSIEATGTHAIIEFIVEDEEREWIYDEEDWIGQLLPLRDELMAGDLRPLYLGWLSAAWYLASETEEVALPPVPPGMGSLSEPQSALAEFLYVSEDLIAAAAADSAEAVEAGDVDDAAVATWVMGWPPERKEAWVRRLLADDTARPGTALRREYLLEHVEAQPAGVLSRPPQVLLDEMEAKTTEREARLAREAEERRQAAAAAAAAAREKHLDSIEGTDDELWRRAQALAAVTQPESYRACRRVLADLRDLARRDLRLEPFELRMIEFRQTHRRKTRLIALLDEDNL